MKIQNTILVMVLSCFFFIGCDKNRENERVPKESPDNFDCPIIASVDSLHLRVREIVVLPGSGTPPFTYSIDSLPFDNNPVKEDLRFGPHFVYVEDAMGCRSERIDFIIEVPKIIVPPYFETLPYVVTWEEGTQWKLYSIDHNERGRTILDPEDCDTCYTLLLDRDETGWKFSGKSIQNPVNIKITHDEFYQYVEVLVTGSDEPFDGNLFCSTIKLVNIIVCDGRSFLLHFNDCDGGVRCNGTMVFKRINQ